MSKGSKLFMCRKNLSPSKLCHEERLDAAATSPLPKSLKELRTVYIARKDADIVILRDLPRALGSMRCIERDSFLDEGGHWMELKSLVSK